MHNVRRTVLAQQWLSHMPPQARRYCKVNEYECMHSKCMRTTVLSQQRLAAAPAAPG